MLLQNLLFLIRDTNEASPYLGDNKHHPNRSNIQQNEVSEHGRNITVPNRAVVKIKLQVIDLKKGADSLRDESEERKI